MLGVTEEEGVISGEGRSNKSCLIIICPLTNTYTQHLTYVHTHTYTGLPCLAISNSSSFLPSTFLFLTLILTLYIYGTIYISSVLEYGKLSSKGSVSLW